MRACDREKEKKTEKKDRKKGKREKRKRPRNTHTITHTQAVWQILVVHMYGWFYITEQLPHPRDWDSSDSRVEYSEVSMFTSSPKECAACSAPKRR